MCETQVHEKIEELSTGVLPDSLETSIDGTKLLVFIEAEWVGVASLDKIREQQLRDCVKRPCKSRENLSFINETVAHVFLKMGAKEAEDRVWF